MKNEYEIIARLTSGQPVGSEKTRLLNDFAQTLGWQPTDKFETVELADVTTAHLLVEHGLENTAVISFFKSPRRYSELSIVEIQQLLAISYNNLVDWHIQIQSDEISYVFNRLDPPQVVKSFAISRREADKLRSEAFEQVTGVRLNPNLPALDDALIRTISFWKRNLSAELDNKVPSETLSALFNTLIFLRAAEDNSARRMQRPSSADGSFLLKLFSDGGTQGNPASASDKLLTALRQYVPDSVPEYIFDAERLAVFNSLDSRTMRALIADFYQNKYAPYRYDFSLMSKHALSRIYERYVSALRLEQHEQLQLLPALPDETRERAFGSICTPQFVARFFARYLREQMAPLVFRGIRSLDPACGSGIFLRTLLELQCEPIDDLTTEKITASFANVSGLDRDENACQATRLSLALLHLVLTDRVPANLDIKSEEILRFAETNPAQLRNYDAVIANPPFVPTVYQDPDLRRRLASFMAEYGIGRTDLYLAFLRIGVEALKPGGFGLFVLPQNFLLAMSASKMRGFLANSCWIRCLVDLTAITVFEDVGSYVVLLVFQKKPPQSTQEPKALVVKCQDLVGKALQYAVEGREIDTGFFSIQRVDQQSFTEAEWHILPPIESNTRRKFGRLPALKEFLEVRLGFISGADDIFLISTPEIPKGERRVYVPYLSDREMELYTTPTRTQRSFFYPYERGRKLDEGEIKSRFRGTWEYLQAHRAKLRDRPAVRRGQVAWWMPERPREPRHLLRPKITTPHLVLVPRFAIDQDGKYAVSHSPFLFPIESGVEEDMLHFFLAVLNSTACFWHITTHSHSYQRGYARLEAATLSQTPVPDPSKVGSSTMRLILRLVEKRLTCTHGEAARALERELDGLVAGLYGLTADERRGIGMEE